MNNGTSHLAFIRSESLMGNMGIEEPKFARDAFSVVNKKEWSLYMADEIIPII